MTRLVVAMDGPAGAGKSTVARGVAAALGYTLVDTGSLYRAVAWMALEAHAALTDPTAVEAVARTAVATGELTLARVVTDTGIVTGVRIHGEDPGPRIRTPELSMGASTVSGYPGVRAALLDAQRVFGAEGGVVLEGRDIGTVVFPNAQVKVFLTASPEVRARRRWEELQARGVDATLEATLAEVIQRDAQDATRAIAPLRQADDAVVVDSSNRDPEAVVRDIVALVRARGG